MLLAGLRLWPHAPLEQAVTSSRVVLADDGSLLRMTLADDGQYRLWLPLERMSPSLVEALLLKEDRNFYWHPGINPPRCCARPRPPTAVASARAARH